MKIEVFEMDYEVLGVVFPEDVHTCEHCRKVFVWSEGDDSISYDVDTIKDGKVVTEKWCKTCVDNDATACEHCGRLLDVKGIPERSDKSSILGVVARHDRRTYNIYCYDCIDECCVQCEECGEWVEIEWSDLVIVDYHESQAWCRDCIEDGAIVCEHCGNLVSYEGFCGEVYDNNDNSDIWCQECLDTDANVCDRCGRYSRNNYQINTENGVQFWCHECTEQHSFYCTCCGEQCDDELEAQDNICRDCYEEMRESDEAVNSYSYKPDPNFNSLDKEEDDDDLFMGMELETGEASEDGAEEAANELSEKYGDFIYLKEDGSIPYYGFEIVTHPFTLGWFKACDFESILKICDEHGLKGHDVEDGKVGIHVHLDKNDKYFSDSNLKRKLYALVNGCQSYWETFSRRPGNKYCEYGCSYETACSNRYCAVNLTERNKHTVEIRIFRSTLKYSTVLATLEACHAIAKYIHYGYMDETDLDMSIFDTEGVWADFCTYIEAINNKKHIYNELVEYMSGKGIFFPLKAVGVANGN